METHDMDLFNEDDAEEKVLSSKPTCFIIVGKPGCGKTTLAKKLAKTWKCQLVDANSAIEYAMSTEGQLGKEVKELLSSGAMLAEETTVQAIVEHVKSPEVSHYGYVLDGFPTVSEAYLPIKEQFQLLQSLALQPDYIIHLKIPDDDLKHRREGFKIDPLTAKIYTREQYEATDKDEDAAGNENDQGERSNEEDGDNDNEEVEDDSDASNVSSDDAKSEDDSEDTSGEDKTKSLSLNERLVFRTGDRSENVKQDLKMYHKNILRTLENFIADHNQQRVIELNANLPEKPLYKALLTKLTSIQPGARALVPVSLQGSEEHDEIPDDADTDDMLRSLAASSMVATGFRWRRSKWGRYCPVSLYEGSILQGVPQFAVSFLDKMYLLASAENLEKFKRCPRMYLLPPQPAPPCKLCIVGGPLAGKSTLAEKMASNYGATIIRIDELQRAQLEERKATLLEETRTDATEAAIARITALMEQEAYGTNKQEDAGDDDGSSRDDESKTRFTPINEEPSDSSTIDEPTSPLDEEHGVMIKVDHEHPEVIKTVAEALAEVTAKDMTLSAEEQVSLIETAIQDIYNQMKSNSTFGPYTGKWILDGFPCTREQFNIMVERGLMPDLLVCLKDSDEGDFLLFRWHELRSKTSDHSPDQTEEVIDRFVPDSAEKDTQKQLIATFEKEWSGLQTAMRSISHLETQGLSSDQSIDDIFTAVLNKMQDPFKYRGSEYSGMDQDEEAEDMADEDDMDDDEDIGDAFGRESNKPFGETRHFCPVMLKQRCVLWPGMPDCAAKYREKIYYFANPEARTQFLANPDDFLPQREALKAPPIRLLILGTKGSGKTHHGRCVAKKLSLFHISFKDHLQELILAKTKKRIGPDYEDPYAEAAEEMTGELMQEIPDTDAKSDGDQSIPGKKDSGAADAAGKENKAEEEEEEVEYSEFEQNIRQNILEDEPLTTETLAQILSPWWNDGLFKTAGFVLEGFPRTTEEVRFLAESGLFPDCCLFLSIEETDIIDRLLPPIHAKWKVKETKKAEVKRKQLEIKLKQKELLRNRRREEIQAEMDVKRLEKEAKLKLKLERASQNEDSDEDDNSDGDDDENEVDDIEAMLDEEMNSADDNEDYDGEEEEEETEPEAVERMKAEIAERYDDDMGKLAAVQESMDEFMIPRFEVGSSRKCHIVEYVVQKLLQPVVKYRTSLFERCQPISEQLANKLLLVGYKFPSRFGWTCPIQLHKGAMIPARGTTSSVSYPVLHRQYIYFLSTEEAREKFLVCPSLYLDQPSPDPTVPVRLSVIGAPKSGKSTLACRFVKEFGLVRLSAGEAIRRVLCTYQHTCLARQIEEHITNGLTVPDALLVVAIETAVLDVDCQMKGFILDGFPMTRHQVELMIERFIIPYRVIELTMSESTVFERGTMDRRSKERVLPLHDSHSILSVRLSCYQKEVTPVRDYFRDTHRNLITIDGEASKWQVWNVAIGNVGKCIMHIQEYLTNINKGGAASIANMCVTQEEMLSRLGSYRQYCPVLLNNEEELVDGSETLSMDNVAEFRSKYYKMASKRELDQFLMKPELYVPPIAKRSLPSDEFLPRKCTVNEVKGEKASFQLKGYCPVTYGDGKLRYESIIKGNESFVAGYNRKLYCLASAEKREKFMRKPHVYCSFSLPHKLPPSNEPLAISGLPMLGYMEQSISIAINESLTAVGCFKPKYPFLNVRQSALLYVAYHLKAFNPRSSEFVRKKYKTKLKRYEEQCRLITFLGRCMTYRYKEPEERPRDFDHKLTAFLSLKEAPPATRWLV